MACAIIFAACKKQRETTAEPGVQIVQPQSLGAFATEGKAISTTPSNPKNPYDFIGEGHNAILQYVDSRGGVTSLNDDQIAVVISEFTSKNYGSALPKDAVLSTRKNIEQFLARFQNSGMVVLNANGSASYKGYLDTLIKKLTGPIESKVSAQPFIKAVIELENQILADKKLSAEERTSILSATSVARHSSLYWEQLNPPATNAKNKIIRWLFTVACDIEGAIQTGTREGASFYSALGSTVAHFYWP